MLTTNIRNMADLSKKSWSWALVRVLVSALKDACVLWFIFFIYSDNLEGWLQISGIVVFSASLLHQLSKAMQLYTKSKQQQT